MGYDILAGIGALILIWLLYGLLAHRWNPGDIVMGSDGRPSTSKLQLLLWTGVIFFSYVAIYAARVQQGRIEAIGDVPANVLIALGMSAVTMAGAKAITASYLREGRVDKAAEDAKGAGAVIEKDDGEPDLTKFQLLGWTLIAMVVYLVAVFDRLGTIHGLKAMDEPLGLPDIDAALMVLTGLSTGTYLGKKLVTTDTPRLLEVQPVNGPPNQEVTLTGQLLGDLGSGQITIDGKPASVEMLEWMDTSIRFKIPKTQLSGAAWTAPQQQILIGVAVNGREAVNPQPFMVTSTP
jgi:hypothetical protein